jgi:hypothetical protein
MNPLTQHYLDNIAALMTEEHEAEDPVEISRLLSTELTSSIQLSAILRKLLEDNRAVGGERLFGGRVQTA